MTGDLSAAEGDRAADKGKPSPHNQRSKRLEHL